LQIEFGQIDERFQVDQPGIGDVGPFESTI
jgi:hypothetical protein